MASYQVYMWFVISILMLIVGYGFGVISERDKWKS